jgi:hypothetical protein
VISGNEESDLPSLGGEGEVRRGLLRVVAQRVRPERGARITGEQVRAFVDEPKGS